MQILLNNLLFPLRKLIRPLDPTVGSSLFGLFNRCINSDTSSTFYNAILTLSGFVSKRIAMIVCCLLVNVSLAISQFDANTSLYNRMDIDFSLATEEVADKVKLDTVPYKNGSLNVNLTDTSLQSEEGGATRYFGSKFLTERTEIEPLQISAGDKLQDFMLGLLRGNGLEDASFLVAGPESSAIAAEGNTLQDHIFNLPGTYTVSFSRVQFPDTPHGDVGHVCDHYSLPEQITVIVNPHRIEYLTGSMTFSEPIVGGQPTEHITVSIQVVVTGEDVAVPTQFTSSGIQTTITGQLNPQQATLSAGTHTLQYTLQGMGKPGTYIQLNFKDANGHEVPCGITTPL